MTGEMGGIARIDLPLLTGPARSNMCKVLSSCQIPGGIKQPHGVFQGCHTLHGTAQGLHNGCCMSTKLEPLEMFITAGNCCSQKAFMARTHVVP